MVQCKNSRHNFKLYIITYGEGDEEFLEVKEKSILEFMQEVEKRYHREVKDIRADKEILREVIREARSQTDVTIEELAKYLEVSKSTVGNYSKNRG